MRSRKYPAGYINISFKDVGIDFQDAGPWRSYELNTEGFTTLELEMNASISEIDQDGGELTTYGLGEAPKEVNEAVLRIIREAVCNRDTSLELKPQLKRGF